MTREELAQYIETFSICKRNMIEHVETIDRLIHAMTSQLIYDEANDSVIQCVIKEYHENAALRAHEAAHEMEELMKMFMKII